MSREVTGARQAGLSGAAPLLLLGTLAALGALVGLPVLTVFHDAFAKGWAGWLAAVADPDARSAIGLTLTVAAIAVPLNGVCGLAAAWTLTRFAFPGRTLLLALIDLPFSLSPVVSGLTWVLLFGAGGWFGPWLSDHGVKIIFALPGLVLATLLVTLPFVARQLIPLMQAQGAEEEAAAVTLGASGFSVLWRVTLPKVRWALLSGLLLCNARAMGEFGAVSVVSGHVRGRTNTLPLHIEALYNDYDFVGAFAAASLLAALGLVTLALQAVLERAYATQLAAAGRRP